MISEHNFISNTYFIFDKNLSAFLLVFYLIFSGCENKVDSLTKYSGAVMGTTYKVSISGSKGKINNSDIFSLLDSVDNEMSTYIPSSYLSQLNDTEVGTWLQASQNFLYVVSYSQELCVLTDGAFDISVGNIVNAWGFGPFEINFFPNKEIINKEKSQIGCNAIQIDLINKSVRRKKDVYLDLSAVAKGFAIDLLAEYLDKLLVENYLIEIGGELRVKGNKPNGKPWVVGIEHPEQSAKTIFTIDTDLIKNFSLATSGNYRNYKKINEKYINFSARKIKNKLKISKWKKKGLVNFDGSELQTNYKAALILPDGKNGTHMFLVFGNYEKILKWNRSLRFGISVCTLAQMIRI